MTSSQQFRQHHYAPPPQANIWTEMSYTPPSGPCKQKLSLMSTCTCFRFMVHPLKAATSFDCDGCGHHASFHKFASPEEEEIIRARREGTVGHGGMAQLEREAGVQLRLEERPRGRLVKRIEDVGVVDVESDEYVNEDEEVVELELPVRAKRRMIAAPLSEECVGKAKGKVVLDLEGGGVEMKKGRAGRKRKG